MTASDPAPLAGIRIVDAVVGPLAPITRYLADLGARVERFAPIDHGLRDRVANIGKLRGGDTLASDDFAIAVERAHIVVASAGQAVDPLELRRDRPALVTMTVSDFGTANALSDWRATGPVLHALSGELSRSGIRGRAPLLPPGDLAYQCAAAQAAFVLASGLYRALEGGVGVHYDFSALDGAVQALDPGYGISGSATMGRPAGMLSRDRPAQGLQYPILPCADGFVRICLLAKRQWRGMFDWLGKPEQFAGPEFDSIAHRYKSRELIPFIAAFFADRSRHDLEREGQRHGVPIAAVMSLEEFVTSDQVRGRNALTSRDGISVPNGVMMIDGQRMNSSEPAIECDVPVSAVGVGRPFEKLKVLDLGIIVVGAEQGRLLADLGADVVKVESRAFPDGNRQSYLSHGMSISFAAGHRNKRSLGLDLRHPDGRALFLELVRQADVLCSNFKPHTLAKLGLGPELLAEVNPRLIMSESSAFGASGPWQDRMGYGPLVRAATGLTLAWRYPHDPASFSDAITIYPDHVAGRIAALGVVALLIRRLRTQQGGRSEVSQAEVILSHFAAEVAALGDTAESVDAHDAPWGAFPAQGDDEWCVVTVRDDADWRALCAIIGADPSAYPGPADRIAARPTIDHMLWQWLVDRPPAEAARMLQAAGVPAAPMLRLADLPKFPYYRERGFYRVERHPWLREPVIAENYVGASHDLPLPDDRPAPLAGEHTRDVIAEWLGLDAATIETLCRNGVLEPLSDETRAAATSHVEAV
ncbi:MULTISPECIES: CoA transferase [unclassified Sphingomonas]|uniref:CaiB/BaiF CoA-transferase family protein n=1 Tax=unclassified Sphingomonas TaxID=196159 RepID=UPI00092A330C|nr:MULTISPECIES: CoA transferase [unclassified Sphingomonas]MBN8848643.1 CoA transferase [Sphingomonas sp.]OJV34769.1 MAG: acyl-CoA hydratase [Sphingomonas sp. 67-36]